MFLFMLVKMRRNSQSEAENVDQNEEELPVEEENTQKT